MELLQTAYAVVLCLAVLAFVLLCVAGLAFLLWDEATIRLEARRTRRLRRESDAIWAASESER